MKGCDKVDEELEGVGGGMVEELFLEGEGVWC